MDALLRKISEFKDSVGEPMGFDSINSKRKVNLVPVPIAKEDAFYGKAKGWLDDLLKSYFSWRKMLHWWYMIKRHQTHAETVLDQNGLTPKVVNEVEVAATMKKAGFGYWPLLHQLIGIGNQLLNFVINYAEEYIQCLSNKERLLRDSVRKLEQTVAEAREYSDGGNRRVQEVSYRLRER
jgi:hypothetical protein